MDNIELRYLTYDPDAIWDEMIAAYCENGGDVLYGGDEKEMLLRGVQAVIVQLLAGVDNALRMATLRYATGDYLKVLGENRGCDYMDATRAEGKVKITFMESRRTKTIPAGTAMTADGVRYFMLAEDIVQTGYAQELTARIACMEAGATGNGVAVGTAMQFTAMNPAVTSMVVTEETGGGMDAEDEEAYRERIRLNGLSSITTGAESWYEAVAKAVTSEVIDASAVRLAAGSVGVYLLLTEGAVADTVCASVKAALSAKDVRPLTDDVTVAVAAEKTYTLNVGYQLAEDADSAVTNAVVAAVDAYQAWQDGTIGQPFNPERLQAVMYQAGCIRVVFQAGCAFDGGEAVYTEISADTRVKGSIQLVVIE